MGKRQGDRENQGELVERQLIVHALSLEVARKIAEGLSHGHVLIPLGLNVSKTRIRAAIREQLGGELSEAVHGLPARLPRAHGAPRARQHAQGVGTAGAAEVLGQILATCTGPRAPVPQGTAMKLSYAKSIS